MLVSTGAIMTLSVLLVVLAEVLPDTEKTQPEPAALRAAPVERVAVVPAPVAKAKPAPIKVATPKKPIGIVRPYTIVEQDVRIIYALKREKASASIRSRAAKTFEDRAATMMHAARDVYRATRATSISIILWDEAYNASSYPFGLGRALYIPDGRGIAGDEPPGKKWKVYASDLQLTEQDIDIMAAWSEYRDEFLDDDNFTDEAQLIPHLAKVLSLREDQIKLPYAATREVSQDLL